MSEVQYPFIDIAVHPGIRDRFAAGQAIILFSLDMNRVLWTNGAGARLFGNGLIYDFLDQGPDRHDVSFRQLEATASQLSQTGDRRSLMIRIASGFQRVAVNCEVERIEIVPDDAVILFAAPLQSGQLKPDQIARQMLGGFDDPDTHMAVVDGEGRLLATSKDFSRIGISEDLARSLVDAAARHPDGLIKRPILTGRGYLPAAIGRLKQEPGLYLLFCVETVLGKMDPPEAFEPPVAKQPDPVPVAEAHDEAIEAKTDIAIADDDGTIEDPQTGQQAAPDMLPEPPLEPAVEAEQADSAILADSDLQAEDELNQDPGQSEVDSLAMLDGVHPDDIATAAEAGGETIANATLIPDQTAPTQDLAESADAAMPVEDSVPGFSFNPAGRPVRFVWKIDADGRFSEVSDEFAATVGPRSGEVNGLSFRQLAERYHLDPNGKIVELLNRRDTWSGRTILWPAEDTNLVVPIDLAALPTYSRNREFDGFRGFGIIRVGDAEVDPHAVGMSFGQVADGAGEEVKEEAAIVSGDEDEVDLTTDDQIETEDDLPVIEEDDDDFRGEVPALKVVTAPGRRFSDKVIQLEERRALAREGLTIAEQTAFREIARQLEPFGKRPNEELEKTEQPDDVAGKPESMAFDETSVEDRLSQIPDTDRTDDSDAGEVTDNVVEVLEPEPMNKITEQAAPDETVAEPADDEAATAQTVDTVEQDDEPSDARIEPEFEVPYGARLDQLQPRALMPDGLNAAIIDQIPLALLVHAGDVLIHANPELLRLSGYDDLAGLQASGGIDGLITRSEGDDDMAYGHILLVRKDDEVMPVSARLQSIRWEGQTALMLAITPVASAETDETPVAPAPEDADGGTAAELAALKAEAEELRSILETATDGVVLVSPEGEIRSMNRSASALFNYDNTETEDRPFAMLFAHESQRAVMDYLAGLAGHGVASVLNDGREVIGREAHGGFIPLFMTIGKLAASNGYCAVIRDITQWKRSEDELKEAKRAAETANAHKSDFLARVSHEIRTPLNAIIGFADMMAGERFGPIGHPRYIEYSNDIGRSGRHVLDIVNDLLDISKIEAGEMDLDFAAVGINDCISEAVSIIQPQANAQRVIIRTSLSHTVPNIVADLRSIKQIALNILANAIRFTPSGGQVVVSTAYEANGSVVLRIRDTGIGMTRTELEQAMKPFRQVTTGTRRRGEGTGLGLPLTKAMAEANRANFTISSAPSEGTLVEITFPSQRVLAD